jgi:hypothetical protein
VHTQLAGRLDNVLKKVIAKIDAIETKLGFHKGKLIQAVNVVAHDIQLRAADMLLKLHNAYPGRYRGDEASNTPVGPYFTLSVANPGVAERVLEKLAAQGR